MVEKPRLGDFNAFKLPVEPRGDEIIAHLVRQEDVAPCVPDPRVDRVVFGSRRVAVKRNAPPRLRCVGVFGIEIVIRRRIVALVPEHDQHLRSLRAFVGGAGDRLRVVRRGPDPLDGKRIVLADVPSGGFEPFQVDFAEHPVNEVIIRPDHDEKVLRHPVGQSGRGAAWKTAVGLPPPGQTVVEGNGRVDVRHEGQSRLGGNRPEGVTHDADLRAVHRPLEKTADALANAVFFKSRAAVRRRSA